MIPTDVQTEIEAQQETAALIAELYRTEEKAEIINGRVIKFALKTAASGFSEDEIFASLLAYSKQNDYGRAVGANKVFLVNLPNRKSFSPDAAFFVSATNGMKFYNGAPVFAVEVRSENDYGKTAERKMTEKRADYFAAGTLVVWDVDLQSDEVIKSYTADNPNQPLIFRRGETANAEPAVPNWTIAVDELFDLS